MNGYLNNFKEQIDTLNKVYQELILPISNQISLEKWWVFGGGTALSMFHFQHRISFDIDIFVTEAQVFDFLHPKWFIDESRVFDNYNYRFDELNSHLQLKTTDNIKVDFLLNESIINPPILNTTLDLDYDLYYESVEDIIAKKIRWRKEDNLTRDIFDIVVAISHDNNIFQNLIDSRYINHDELLLLNKSLKTLNIEKYNIEISKIKPQTKEYKDIAKNAKRIIQSAVNSLKYIS